MRRRPKMSPSRPPVTSSTAKLSVYALTVHSRLDRLAPRSFWIDGSATFTTVLSSMIMNSAKHMAASVHHLRLPSCRRRRSGIRGLLVCVLAGAGADRAGAAHRRDILARDDRLERLRKRVALRFGERLRELLEAGEAEVDQPAGELERFVGGLDRLGA